MQTKTLQILLISGAAVLSVALYLAPRKTPPADKTAVAQPIAKQEFNFDDLLAFQNKNLSEEERTKSEIWLKDLQQPASRANLNLYDSLAGIWDSKRMFALSAYYYEQKAEKDKSEKSYINASFRYFDAYKNSIDSTLKANMVDRAIKNYSKVIELDSNNLNAKTDLGILYAEATSEPMKGIMMLREVVAQDPNHENAQLNLGFLSVRSNQLDKALERFDKVLEINPQHIDAYILKARVYVQMGEKQKAIDNFEQYKKRSTDLSAIQQVNEYIAELKK
ncbi:MAG TPA: tetratricopeptide repeat protein [Bacteroidia bacterium]|nr:tetratricopeptide repeat protein [Bacteroidia bacterium]